MADSALGMECARRLASARARASSRERPDSARRRRSRSASSPRAGAFPPRRRRRRAARSVPANSRRRPASSRAAAGTSSFGPVTSSSTQACVSWSTWSSNDAGSAWETTARLTPAGVSVAGSNRITSSSVPSSTGARRRPCSTPPRREARSSRRLSAERFPAVRRDALQLGLRRGRRGCRIGALDDRGELVDERVRAIGDGGGLRVGGFRVRLGLIGCGVLLRRSRCRRCSPAHWRRPLPARPRRHPAWPARGSAGCSRGPSRRRPARPRGSSYAALYCSVASPACCWAESRSERVWTSAIATPTSTSAKAALTQDPPVALLLAGERIDRVVERAAARWST